MFVYLDTNAYISANYIFDTDNMGKLNKLIEAGEVTLLYTSATMGEVEQHLAEDISAAVQKYNRVLRKEMPALKYADSYMLKELNIQEVVDAVKIKAKAFLNRSIHKVFLLILWMERYCFGIILMGVLHLKRKNRMSLKMQ